MRILRWSGTIVAAATVASLGLASPASAAGTVVLATDQTATSSVGARQIIVDCPNSAPYVLGGGGYVFGGSNRVSIGNFAPVIGATVPDDFTVGAAEVGTSNFAGSWRVHGYAICGPQLDGLEYVYEETTFTTVSPRHQRVTCPGAKKVLSAGGVFYDEDDHVVIDDISITADQRNVDVWAIEREEGTVLSWAVGAYAVCVNSNAVDNLHLVTASSLTSTSSKSVDVSCGTQQLYGLGGSLATSGGHTTWERLVPNDLHSATFSVRTDSTGAPAAWTATIQAVCGDLPD